MKNHFPCCICLVLFLVVGVNIVLQELGMAMVVAMPTLHTTSRWIVNEDEKRVKLACVNWPSHLETVLAEGLNKRPVDDIAKNIVSNGFNCVRFTWPVALPTNDSLATTTVRIWFKSLGLDDAIAGIEFNNPQFLDITLIQAYQKVVKSLSYNNVMVILDNHISKPGWCCSIEDGNGFFGDEYFDPELWLKGLANMSTIFRDSKNVVGMSLRNELRGPNQNSTVWHRYMEKGAEIVHEANPNVLVILSGLYFDNNLSFLKEKLVNISFTNKLVFEVHRYAVSNGNGWWESHNPNVACGSFMNSFMSTAGFLLEQGFPLFLSEFGGDQTGMNLNDNRFLNCIFGVIADLDLDWALWTLQGSYYLRNGEKDHEELYGVFNKNWDNIRNSSFMQKVNSIQLQYQGPGLNVVPYNLIYHPSSGLCVLTNSNQSQVRLGLCEASTAWSFGTSSGKSIKMNGTDLCLQAVEVGKPVNLVKDCSRLNSQWEMISYSNMHISSKFINGDIVCLDVAIDGVVITSLCNCLNGDPTCEPSSQWFKIIKSTRDGSQTVSKV